MKHNKEIPTSETSLTTSTNLWINLVGDSEGFEGDTVKDKHLLNLLVGKTSFTWPEYEALAKLANSHDYGLGIIIIERRKAA